MLLGKSCFTQPWRFHKADEAHLRSSFLQYLYARIHSV